MYVHFFFCRDGLVEGKLEYLDDPDLLWWRYGSVALRRLVTGTQGMNNPSSGRMVGDLVT
jgi:hypothetical protein